MTCTCPPDISALLAGSLAGEATPPCDQHRPALTADPASVALNDDAALLGSIRAALDTYQPDTEGEHPSCLSH